MELESLNVHSYSGELKGRIKFKNELGTIELVLDEQASREVVRTCADSLIRISQKAATEMNAKVVDALISIPSKPEQTQ